MSGVIHSYLDTYGPRFFVKINGQYADDIAASIIEFSYSDDEKKTDQLVLKIVNPNLTLVDDKRFQNGVRFQFRWGYANDVSEVRNAVIVQAKPSFAKGQPIIELVAGDLRIDLNKRAKPQNYGRVSSSDVAKIIAARWGLGTDMIKSSDDVRNSQQRVQPVGTTDMQYLMSLATKLNWDFWIEENQLAFQPKNYNGPPVVQFNYYTDGLSTVLEFSPEVNPVKPAQAGVAGANPKDGHATAPAGGGTDKTQALARRKVTSVTPQGTELVIGGNYGTTPHQASGTSAISHATAEQDKKIIQAHASAALQKIDMKAAKAKLKVIGTPRLKARVNIRLMGVLQMYSGNWHVAATRHTITSKGVYTTEADLVRNAVGVGAKKADTPVNDKHATPQHGKQVGVKVASTTGGNIGGGYTPP